MSNLNEQEILRRYPPCLRDNLNEIMIAEMNVGIMLPPNKLDPSYEINRGNSLMLDIPYAGKVLQSEIIFNDEDLTFPPDFDVVNDTFLSDPDVDVIENCLPSLANWNINNPKALISFLQELINLYKKHQIEKLNSDSKYVLLQEEYRQLKEKLHLNDDDLQILIDNNSQHFLIPIKLDYSKLPVYIQETYFGSGVLMNPGADWAMLKISFLPQKCNTVLQLSPRLESVFGNYSSLHIPPYKKTDDMIDYVNTLKELMSDKMKQIQEQFTMKQNFIGALLARFGSQIMEWDNVGFSKVTFLFQVESFHFLTEIALGNGFPMEQPLLTLRSIYHRDVSGEPVSMQFKNYPYNPKWKLEEMIEKLAVYIRSDINRFKTHSLNTLSQ